MDSWAWRCGRSLCVALAAACTDDSAAAGLVGDSASSLYLIATHDQAQDATYLVTADSFDRNTEVAIDDGPKRPGRVTPVVRAGTAYVPDATAPVIHRFDSDRFDRLEQTRELSFADQDVTQIDSSHVFLVADDKGYVFDPRGARILVWNPETMVLTGKTIDLSEIRREGWTANLVLASSGPQRRADQLLIPLSWQDSTGASRHASGVVVLDAERDELVAVHEDERCGESYSTVRDPDGASYFFPPSSSAGPAYFADRHRPTCVLRIAADSDAFDPDFSLDLSQLGSGSAAAGAVPDGETGFFFTAVDEARYEDPANTGDYWRFWHYDFETEQSHSVDALPNTRDHGSYVRVDDTFYIPSRSDTHQTTLYRVDGSQDPKPLFSFAAECSGVMRLR